MVGRYVWALLFFEDIQPEFSGVFPVLTAWLMNEIISLRIKGFQKINDSHAEPVGDGQVDDLDDFLFRGK